MSDAQRAETLAGAVVEADLTWLDGRFQRGVRIRIDSDGTIAAVGVSDAANVRLHGHALLPGFVNAHSHSFQRGLRGKGEKFAGGAGSFWSWREAMYSLVERLDADQLYDLSRRAFTEMLRAGITAVGEFHYLHHEVAADRDHRLDEAVIRAAADAGIRLVLLFTFYRSGGIAKPLAPAQRRFETASLSDYWKAFDRASALLDSSTQTIGVVAHSIRAATLDECAELYTEARRCGHVFHMHVEEQELELRDSNAAYGANPLRLLLNRLPSTEGFTAVHCTHSDAGDLSEFVHRGGNVCITPLTEANLGDGVPIIDALRTRGGAVSLGSDSNARISMLEEMRWLEYAQRLRQQARGIWADESGSVGTTLMRIATEGGARSLGLRSGEIAARKQADFCLIDLDAASLAGVEEDALEDALIFGCGDEVISRVCVGGRWRS